MPVSFNFGIELHDSTIESVSHTDQMVQVALRPAYVHRSSGVPGVDSGACYVQDFVLEFRNARVDASFGALPADIFDGMLVAENCTFDNLIPVPCDLGGPVSLTVFLSPDNRRISVTGFGMKAVPAGEAKYIEDFQP